MGKYEITLMGCDDNTTFEIELTETEKELVDKLCRISKETSTYGCMPIMECAKKQEE